MNLAFHYLGCAVRNMDGSIGTPSRVGPLLDGLAGSVERLFVVAYDPPAHPYYEDGVEYAIRAPNVEFVSLGPKGSRRDVWQRRRRAATAVRERSERWDTTMYWLPNRRAHLVHNPNRSPRSAGFVVGTTERPAFRPGTPYRKRLVSKLTGSWTERQKRDVLRGARLGIVNSPELLPEVEGVPVTRNVYLSTRRAQQVHEVADRFTNDAINIIVSGRLTLEKGVHDAVDAFAIVRRTLPNATLHLAGDGPARTGLEEQVAALGLSDAVVFHGWLPADDRLYDLYAQMDVLLLPSYAAYEGFPCVIWEAMAQSVLVVSTPVRGPRSALEHEQDLLFVPARDPASMAEAIVRLARDGDLRRRMIACAFEKAGATSIEATVAKIVDGITAAWPELASRRSE